MEKHIKSRYIILSISIILSLLFLLIACKSTSELLGIYEGISEIGLPVSMEFTKDAVITNLFGFPANGIYEVNGKNVTINLTISMLGISQIETITGKIDGDNIVFADITFTKKGNSNQEIASNFKDTTNNSEENRSLQSNNILNEVDTVAKLDLPLVIVNNFDKSHIDYYITNDSNMRSNSVVGNTHFFITNDDVLLGYGVNKYGQLGDNTGIDSNDFVIITENVANLYIISDDLILAVKNDKSLWGWGTGMKNILPNLSEDKFYAPVKILDNVVKIVHTNNNERCVLQSDGTLWTWSNTFLINEFNEPNVGNLRKVMKNIKEIYAKYSGGNTKYYVVKGDNSLWTWKHVFDVFGNSIRQETKDTLLIENVDKLYFGNYHMTSMAVTYDGVLYEWDYDNTLIERLSDVREAYQPSGSISTAREWFGFAVRNDNTLWAWGANNNAQLGDGTKINRSEPIKIANNVNKIISNGTYLSTNGEIYGWGSNIVTPNIIYSDVKEAYSFYERIILLFNSNIMYLGDRSGWNTRFYVLDNVKEIIFIDDSPYFEILDGSFYEMSNSSNTGFSRIFDMNVSKTFIIEAVHFDSGSYKEYGVSGEASYDLRPNESVQTEFGESGFLGNIGWTRAGELVRYTIDVEVPGTYNLRAYLASGAEIAGNIEVYQDYETIGMSEIIGITKSNDNRGWQVYEWWNVGERYFREGTAIITVVFYDGNTNLAALEFTRID